MLLFIGQDLFANHLWTDFKTSYVTVYHIRGSDYRNCWEISKHRMLLFIFTPAAFMISLSTFQNIVCYCLSLQYERDKWHKHISKHRMLLFIKQAGSSQTYSFSISKHRMLLFIRAQSIEDSEAEEFQNIVCYCLSISGIRSSFGE